MNQVDGQVAHNQPRNEANPLAMAQTIAERTIRRLDTPEERQQEADRVDREVSEMFRDRSVPVNV
jgi:hypothetical protein